jgi:hypothetical protein
MIAEDFCDHVRGDATGQARFLDTHHVCPLLRAAGWRLQLSGDVHKFAPTTTCTIELTRAWE